MTEAVLEVRSLVRTFGSKRALDGASFTVRPGVVTGFLGPNGAGKTTAIRILLGLDRADAGEALITGRPFRELAEPSRLVGTILDGSGFHPNRSGREHLRVIAAYGSTPATEVDAVLSAVDLTDAADQRVGGYSLGMRRRLGLASALLGDPSVLILDEPANGLDPAGVRWLRETLRSFAARGGTVFVSSHALAEVAQTAEDLVVIDRGRVIAQTTVQELTAGAIVIVRSAERDRLAEALAAADTTSTPVGADGLEVSGTTTEAVGRVAAGAGVPLSELTARGRTLEEVFLSLTEEGA